MASARISGSVTCDEFARGAVSVAAYPERVADNDAAATALLPDGPGTFSMEVPPGTWWLQAALEQTDVAGPRSMTAWSREPVTVGEGERVDGVAIVMEVPEQVR
ncbi:MAG: hypothetical protein QOK40_2688 [Miltoncostaeaceae bacterium]|jgi:hypothetical protein|nr:hypothetical protein [Miltoncostaeaceae bacterium]